MRNKLNVTVSDRTGLPYANVPTQSMWDLVEFLSFHRVAVSYEYRASHFTVCFLRSSRDTAQKLLDDWCVNAPADVAKVH